VFYCPYHNYTREPVPNPVPSRYRLLHASPDAPPVDIYINGKLVAQNLKYANFTNYLQAPGGIYEVKVFPTGKKDSPVINTRLQLIPGSIYTIAAVGNLRDVSLLPILEPLPGPTPGYAMIRFSHLSPGTPAVDITLPDGRKLFQDVEFKETTGYIPVPPGNYTIQARPTGTDKVALIVPSINLQGNKIYTIYAVGLLNGKPPLQVLIPLDGSTYLR
jgi:hypothetical protein